MAPITTNRRPNVGIALLHASQSLGGVPELRIPESVDPARSADFG
jgi:hypothetical protein